MTEALRPRLGHARPTLAPVAARADGAVGDDPAHVTVQDGVVAAQADGLYRDPVTQTVAALYVDPAGVYANLPNVEVWDEARDARLYAGPHPVVAHPPCARWSLMGLCRGYYDGEDDGCFEAALNAVRMWGGVLEHPAHTLAWRTFGLPRPASEGWSGALFDTGVTCEVDQRWYGHAARKPTWLYYVGQCPPALRWGAAPRGAVTVGRGWGGGREHLRAATPLAFRDVLLSMAREGAAG